MNAMMKKLFLVACSSLAIGTAGCLAGSDQGIDENVAEADDAIVTPSAFSGEASLLDGQVAGITPAVFPVAPAGPQPPAGGTFTNSILNFSLGGISLGAGNTSTIGTVASGASNSQAQLASLTVGVSPLGIPVNVLSAGVVQSTASATCTQASLQLTLGGASSIANLTLLGTPITVSGLPNQTVSLNLGLVSASLIINEQTSVLNPTNGQISVSALHLTVSALGATLLDLRLLNSEADITCAGTIPVCRAIDWFTANQGVIQTAGHPGTFAFALGTINGAPAGNLTYQDFVTPKLIKATSITTVTPTGPNSRAISGLATVDGVPNQLFFLQIADNGAGPTDSFNITVAGYNANGLLTHSNIEHTVNPCFTSVD